MLKCSIPVNSHIYYFDKNGSYLPAPHAGGLEGCRKPASKVFNLMYGKKPNIYQVKEERLSYNIDDWLKLCRKSMPAQADRLLTLIVSKPQ